MPENINAGYRTAAETLPSIAPAWRRRRENANGGLRAGRSAGSGRYHVVDANAMLGRGDWTEPDKPTTVAALLAEMDHAGIHEALVRDSAGQIGDPNLANARVLEKTAGQKRLHPVWMLLPPCTRETPPPAELVSGMRAHGVAAAWLNYGAYGLPLTDWAVDAMLGPLAEARVPVFMDPNDARKGARSDFSDWSGIVRVCRAFPDLPVIVTEERVYKTQRTLWAALAACPNLYVDVSILWAAYAVEFIVREFGAERLVLGTQLPERCPGVAVMQVQYGDLAPSEIASIAGGNIRRLISWNPSVKPPVAEAAFPPPDDDLHRKARDAADFSTEEFYDCHGHLGLRNQRHMSLVPRETLIEEMDRLGIRKGCVFGWISHGEVRAGNDLVIDAVRSRPDRFIGFTIVYPQHGVEEARAELERGLDQGMRGIKLLSTIHRYPDDGPVIDLCCRFAHEHGLFILNHQWRSPEVLRRWLESYSGACYLTGHADDRLAALTREFPNLFICSCPLLTYGKTGKFVELYGADRILFGSDLLDLPIAWGVAPIVYARIPESDKRLILGGNLQRLLKRYGQNADSVKAPPARGCR